jgi:hypothetical protein
MSNDMSHGLRTNESLHAPERRKSVTAHHRRSRARTNQELSKRGDHGVSIYSAAPEKPVSVNMRRCSSIDIIRGGFRAGQ